jgi:exosortase
LCLIYFANLRHFVYTWITDENYTHGFLVPLISLYFAREAMRKGPFTAHGGTFLGSILLVVSILARLTTILVPVGIVGDAGFIVGLAGICVLMGGVEALKRFGFAIAFLIFMVPLPMALYTTLASPLQRMVSQVGGAILNGLGIPVLCEGNLMTLPGDVHMFVAEACSGIRQLTGFLALTIAGAYLSNSPAWYRAIVVLSAVPIAMTANVLRVTLTGVIMYRFGSTYATGNFHMAEGIVMMGVGLALLWAECQLLTFIASCADDRSTELAS